MTVQSYDNLRTRANQIRNETAGFANNEVRVGSLLQDMIDSTAGSSGIVPAIVFNDDTAAVANMAAINASVVAANAASVALTGACEVRLPDGKFSVAGTMLVMSNVTVRGGGMGKTIMYAPAANYTNTTWNSRDATSMVIDASGLLIAPFTPAQNMKLCDFTIEFEVSDGRVLYGIRASNVQSLEISNVEVFGIPVGNAIEINTILGNSSVHHCQVRDCGTAVTTYSTQPQMTGIEIDNAKVDSGLSRGVAIHDNSFIDLMFSGAALGTYGAQTDGINAAHGFSLRIHNNYMRNVGEGIDLFCLDSDVSGNTLADCYHAGIKLIHGASRNNAHGNTILRPGRAGFVLEGRSAETRDNFIHGNLIHDVNVSGVWDAQTNAAFLIVSGGGIEANDNTIRDNKVTGGANMDYVIRNEAGAGNRYYDNEAESFLLLYSSVSGGSAVIVNAKKTLVRASIGTGQVTASGTEVTVDYDTETEDTQSEFDTSSNLFTATSHRRLRVYAQVRSTGTFTGLIKIRLNGATRAQTEPGIAIATIAVSDSFSVVPGDTIDIRFVQSTGAVTLTNNTVTSYLTIEEVAG
jgi:hypothetical protein